MIINQLKSKLSLKWLLDGYDLKKKYEELANILLNEVVIKKGECLYWITDIEFYLYTPKHKDIITYPRNCEAGQWFFHNSGVDISFESKVGTAVKEKTKKRMAHLTEDSAFGGILIKAIEPAWVEDSKDGAITDLKGPQKLCDELFDMFDAFGNADNFPQLAIANNKRNNDPKSAVRHNLLPKGKTEEKIDSILANHYYGSDIEKDDLVKAFDSYLSAKYRFHI
jgi:hypothetical protein